MAGHEVVIAGGGVAGIAAAVELSRKGVRVCLVEAKRRLGGRATSFVDSGTGETLDNCQHVALGCCTNYIALCERLGVMDQFDWYPEQYWVEAGGQTSIIAPGRLPAPLHYAGSFHRAAFLSLTEKIAIARGMVNISLSSREMYRDVTFGQYLVMGEQPAGAIAKFWSPIVVSACNMHVERVCAATALKVFQDGFLKGKSAGVMGVPKVPLVRLYDRAMELVEDSGGRIMLGTSVEVLDGNGVTLSSGEQVCADRVICALPIERAMKVVRTDESDTRLSAAAEVTFSPILGVHLEFDRPVLGYPHAVLVNRPTQWLFRKDAEGRRIHAVISAAEEWMRLDEEEILRAVVADIRACFPESNRAMLQWGRAVKERRATFAATPGFEALRNAITALGPHARGVTGSRGAGVGVILAGDYTNTGWPPTMEGATMSGLCAAAAAMQTTPWNP